EVPLDFLGQGHRDSAGASFAIAFSFPVTATVQIGCFFKNPPQPVESGFGWKGLNFGIPPRVHLYRWSLRVPAMKVA
ncbi:MAG: hypothetical protein AB2784_21335, partial [Candidatus Thiodiazotropha endolucinida]